MFSFKSLQYYGNVTPSNVKRPIVEMLLPNGQLYPGTIYLIPH